MLSVMCGSRSLTQGTRVHGAGDITLNGLHITCETTAMEGHEDQTESDPPRPHTGLGTGA